MTQLHPDDTEPNSIFYSDENSFLREIQIEAKDYASSQRCPSCKHYTYESTGDGYNEPREFNDRDILDCLLARYCDKSRPRQEDLAAQRDRYISDNYEALRALDTNQVIVYPDWVRLRVTVSVWGEDGENMFVNTEDV